MVDLPAYRIRGDAKERAGPEKAGLQWANCSSKKLFLLRGGLFEFKGLAASNWGKGEVCM